MANEFVARNGVIAQNNSVVSGSLVVTNGITGSLFGTSSQALSASYTATSSFGLNAISASYAFTASSAISSSLSQTASFALRGSGAFTGSFSGSVTASLFGTASQATSASYAFTASSAVSSSYAYTASSATTASTVIATVTGTNSTELVRGNMADNDQFRILVGGTATNAGYAEIATADDGTEPIYVRQYTGVFSSLIRTATLLDGSGNTSFPGIVSASFSGSLNGTASFASNYLGSGSISTRLTNLETASGSFSTRVTNTETTASNLVAASSSFSSRVSSIEATTASLQVASGSFSTRVTQIERTYATTGSNIYTGSQNILGAITASAALINGTITAQTLVVTTVSSSVVFSSGSNIFGNSTANTQTMTGSLNVSGSATIVGRVTATDLTGSLFGTSSQALTASYIAASGVVGLNLSLISTGSVTASVGQSTSSFQVTSGSNTLMILNNSGSLTIGSSPASQLVLRVSRNITGNVISRGVIVDGTIQTDVTNAALMFSTSPATIASAFTLPTLYNYYASGVSTGSSSVVTNQYGFYAESNMVNATNNYGFYGNIPSGSNRWNLYMAGTADNYLAGNLGIGTTLPKNKLDLQVASKSTILATDSAINVNYVGSTIGQFQTIGFSWEQSISNRNSYWGMGLTGTNYSSGLADLFFFTNGSERMRISQTGLVGIGKTPSNTLDVLGNTLITGSLGVTGPITGSSILSTGTITAQTLVVTTVSSSVVFSSGSNIFGNNLANTQTFTGSINATGSTHTIYGNLGIGATGSSAYNLDVSGSMRLTNNLVIQSRGSIKSGVISHDGTNLSINYGIANQSLLIGSLSSPWNSVVFAAGNAGTSSYAFYAGGTGSLFITNSGSVYISSSLGVSGGITGSLFGTASQAISSSYALTASFALNGGGGTSFPYTGSAQITGSLGVTGSVSVTGNTGGTVFSSNADTLLITGSLIITGSGATITGSLNVSNGITGSLFGTASQAVTASYALTASYVASIAGLSTSQIATGSITASVSLGSGSFAVTSGSSTFLFVSSSGNVGFGTTTNLNDRLTVLGNAVIGRSNTTSQVYIGLGTPGTVTPSSLFWSFGLLANSNDFNIQSYDGTTLSSRLRIDTSGRVGIGTSTPSASLDVSGSVRITNGLSETGSVNISGSLTVTGSITTNGTITAQTLVVQTITSSIEYSSGSNIFGSQLTDRQTMTGSINMTGSLNLYGNQNITGSLNVSGSLTLASASLSYQHNLSVTAGGYQVIVSAATGSYRCAFFDYVMFSGSIVRGGTVTSTWSGSSTEYYENYTADLGGSTSGVTLQTALSTGNIQLQASASTAAWTIRSLIRLL